MLNHASRFATDPGMAAAIGARASAGASASPLSRCEVLDNIAQARAAWSELQALPGVSPYQDFGFVEAWFGTVGLARTITPMIIVARDDGGRVNAVLPFGRVRRGPVWTAEFLGGADANFKMGMFRPGLAIGRGEIEALLRSSSHAAAQPIDAFWMTNQPLSWQGVANPMATLPRQPSPSFGHKTSLTRDFDDWLKRHHSKEARKKLRQKERRLNALAPLSHVVARDEPTARKILAAFLAQKDERMRIRGAANTYEQPHTARFFDIAATRPTAQAAPILELHALMSGARIVATFGAALKGDRCCGMFISHDSDAEIARCSPGQLLILETIRDLCARDIATFDLGVGEARYKDANCETDEPLFDAAVGVSKLGFAFCAAALLRGRIKRWVKHTPWAWEFVEKLRRQAYYLRGGRGAAGGPAPDDD
jgi:CelD/BcsL family acetyltransferase involved in cellulose biosynthesis